MVAVLASTMHSILEATYGTLLLIICSFFEFMFISIWEAPKLSIDKGSVWARKNFCLLLLELCS